MPRYQLLKVRKAPRRPRSWANFIRLSLYSYGDAWASARLLGRPNAPLARKVSMERRDVHPIALNGTAMMANE